MIRRTTFLAAAGLFAISVAAQQGIVLRRELKENTAEIYKMETDMRGTVTVPSMGDQDLGLLSTMKVTVKTSSVDAAKGEASVETTISDIQTKADGMMQMVLDQGAGSMPKEMKSKGTMDARNRMVMTSAANMGMAEMMFGGSSPASTLMFIEFPESAVNVGDSWTFGMPKNPLFGKEAPLITAKLVGDKDFQGGKVWVISMSGKINLDADLSEMMKNMPNNPMAGQKAKVKGTIDMTGEALVDKTSGRTLLYTSNAKSKSTVDLTDMGMSIDTANVVKTTLTLQK